MNTKINNIDEYILQFPDAVQNLLQTVRHTIKKSLPAEASEKISYAIPTFYLHENIIHFAAFKNHIGIYPGAKAIEHFAPQLTKYKTSKGAIQLPLNEKLPINLITQLVAFRIKEAKQKK